MHRSGCKGAEVGCYAKTWGECARSAGMTIAWANSANGSDYTREKKFRAENERYAQAVRDGLDPETPTNAGVDKAYREREAAEKITGGLG